MNGTPTSLYRAFNAAGQLLYIGIARHWARRWVQHLSDKPWAKEVARVEVETYPTRQAAELAERQAIADERPRYNVTHNRPSGRGRSSALLEAGWERIGSNSWRHPDRPGETFTSAAAVAAHQPADKPKRTIEHPPIVAAFGLVDGECPVGLVIEDDGDYITIALFNWLIEQFGEHDQIRRSDIRQIKHGTFLPPRVAEDLGFGRSSDIWDMEPLGAFQTEWCRMHKPPRQRFDLLELDESPLDVRELL